MFKELGQIASLLRNGPKLREEMDKLQQRLGQLTAEGDAGAGMVQVRVNGRMEIMRVTLSDEAIQMRDKELLEDLIKGAVNQALTKAREVVAEETTKAATSMTGSGLPDFTNMLGK